MDKAEVLIPVSVIVDAIVAFYGGDTNQVVAFYEAAFDKLHGMNAEVDAVLDGIDNWLIGRWPTHIYTREEVLSMSDSLED